MKTAFACLCVFLFSHLIFTFQLAAQAPSIEWKKCYGGSFTEDGYCIAATQDGGYVMAGKASSSNGDVSGMNGYYDLWVLKVSSNGTIQWQNCLGGDGEESARSIQQTSDGGYIVAGHAQSNNGDVSGHHGGYYDAWIVKLNSTGTLEWQKCLGGSADDIAYSIKQTTEGGYIMAGYTKSTDGNVTGNHGWTDVWVVKLSSSGNLEWQKCYGGSEADQGWSVCLSPEGGYAVMGYTASNDSMVVGHHGNFDAWVLKINNLGELEWQKCIGGNQMDFPFTIIPAAEGGYMVCGETGSNDGDVSGNHGGTDAWLVKISGAGQIEWQKCYGGSNVDNLWDVKQGADGTYTMAGYSYSTNGDVSGNHGSSDFWIVNVSQSGQLNWQKCLGGLQNENARGVIVPAPGSAIVFGYTISTSGDISGNHGQSDFWLVKLNGLTPVEEKLFSEEAFSVYPNPASDILHISFQGDAVYSLAVCNAEGRKLLEKSGLSGRSTVELKDLESGLYWLRVNRDGRSFVRSFIH